ncbi:haloacid dehalogenase [Marinitoga sp. 1135]|uniref:HAD-superfamily hydrolase, subfamily IIIA n=1 Tax=Marinitoga piezophila (strain DSM 14283 / JCM 11233 / KA3) TaxID=443254 RepID=H2J4V6_MARPK|nr:MULTISPECIES: YqeG family HAD IIIA-type phosphatase [Marinitoga]AEX84891.1 HAD-superfamily hydrolase, subfamily IIIA [Marinitoga piezophila KA3]APT75394.1 haloacid dehalogenase [Marinitoga sp. 1137]NUU95126.1 haloacid dehalogenase [Marinitoga sp. 1135]NUU97058.1 haloacid dehalogenase [Marinitoga sp. 1138]
MNPTTGKSNSRKKGIYRIIPIPYENYPSIFEIDYNRLKKLGFKTLLFDYDFTLAPWKQQIDDKTIVLFEKLSNLGFKIAIVSNAPEKRIKHVKEKAGEHIHIYWRMHKPLSIKIKKIFEDLKTTPAETVIIGDLFFTDILLGNRLGLYTILVNPYTYEIDSFFKKIAAFLSKILYYTFFYTLGWLFRMLDHTIPNEFVNDVFEIDYKKLKDKGFKLLIFDFDNTLTTWRNEKLPDEILNLFDNLSKDFKILIASNGKEHRFHNIREELKRYNIDVMGYSLKPFPFKIRKKIKEYNIPPSQCVLIGDQLFTDIIAGNKNNFYTIKVKPISKHERVFTKILRFFEKIAMKSMREKPKV